MVESKTRPSKQVPDPQVVEAVTQARKGGSDRTASDRGGDYKLAAKLAKLCKITSFFLLFYGTCTVHESFAAGIFVMSSFSRWSALWSNMSTRTSPACAVAVCHKHKEKLLDEG